MAPNNNNDNYTEILPDPHGGDRCDESKCVSSGLSSSRHSNSFTCYGDDDGVHPGMCADGYLPRVLEDEPPIMELDRTFRYFTCCPPTLPSKAILTRHCSEPETAIIDDDGEGDFDRDSFYTYFDDIDVDTDADANSTATPRMCFDENRPYPRRMNSRRYFRSDDDDTNEMEEVESHVCCASFLEDEPSNNYLSDTECVPYHSEFYTESAVHNSYGRLSAITCHFPDGSFGIPRLVDSHHYECCRTGQSPPPFLEDAAFGRTIYPQIALSSIAVACSVVTILSLSIPLAKQLLRRTDPRRPSDGRSSLTTLRRTLGASFRGSLQQPVELPEGTSDRSMTVDSVDAFLESLRRKKMPASQSKFSTYNLYLVYLAIPDLLLNTTLLGLYASYASNKAFHSGLCGFIVDGCADDQDGILFTSILSGYWAANIYLNAIVAYEVYALLKDSKNFQRHTPPSIRKVTVQAATIGTLSVLVAISYYFLDYGEKTAANRGSHELSSALFLVQKILLNAVLLGFVPILFFPSVCFGIWRRKLMPTIASGATTTRDKALRELAWYFFRIVSVFAGCWIPVAVISAIGGPARFSITFLVVAMQQILSTGVSLTKSDVRKHVLDVFRWCCCCCCCCCADHDTKDSDRISQSMHFGRPKSSELVSSTSKMASMAEE